MMIVTFLLSISAAAYMVYADTDNWENHATTTWYNEDYMTFTIDTPDKLAGVAKLVNSGVTNFDKKVLEVSVNLDLKDYKWVPVGSLIYPFKGTLVGKGGQMFNLSGLSMNNSAKQTGLFGYLSGATVGGLHVLGNIQVNSSESVQVGAIAGYMDQNSTVYNIINEAAITVTTAKDAFVGGVVGGGSGVLSNIVNQASVTLNGSSNGIVGGIAATSTGEPGLTLKKIENLGAVTVSNSVYQANAGGLVGLANASLSMGNENTMIRNSGAVMALNNKNSVIGGLLGRVEGGTAVSFSNQTSNSGPITVLAPGSKGSFVGGLVGSFEQNMTLDVPFTQTGTITNQAGSSVYTGGVTGIVYGDLLLGKGFTNNAPLVVSGEGGLYTGGIVGKTGGNVSFTSAAQNKASLQVTGSGDQIYTGGLVGFVGNRMFLNGTSKDDYSNSGQITVSGVSDIYTGGITSNKAYIKAADNVQSLGDITVRGSLRLFTGGYIGKVSGSDTNMSRESFSNKITVTAASPGEDSAVFTGGIVGYYGVNGTISSPVFKGQLTVNGGMGANTGGVAGYVESGTIIGAAIGGTAENVAKLASDGHVGGVAGYLSGTVSAATVRYVDIQSTGVGGYAGGAAGQAKGSMTDVTIGQEDAANNGSVTIGVTAGNTAAGGIVGADDGALLLGGSKVNKVTVTSAAGADHARVGGVAGAASASMTLGTPTSGVVVHDVMLTSDGAESKVGGIVGDNSSELIGGLLQEVAGVGIDAKGDGAFLGGIAGYNRSALTGLAVKQVSITAKGLNNAIGGVAGFTRGHIVNPHVVAGDGGVLQLKAEGRDSTIGGIAGSAEDGAIQGNGQDANVAGVAITTSSTASGAQVGGIVGSSNKTSLQTVIAESPVLMVRGANTMVGGLAGQIKDASITQSYARGVMPDYVVLNIFGSNSHGGGLAGQAERVNVTGNAASFNVENLTLVVDSSASGVHAGGFVGTNIESKIEKVFGQFINLTPKGPQSVVGGLTGYNKGTETALLNQNFVDTLAINVPSSATTSTIGGMIGLNDARSGQADAVAIVKAVSTVQNSRVLGKLIVHAPSSTTGGMIGENRSIVANNSIAEKLPVTSDGNFGVVGGLIGKNTGTTYYTYSNALLSVSGSSTVAGGLVGENSGNVIASYIENDLKGDAVGTSGNYTLLGGLVGKNSGSVDKSFTSSNVTANGVNTYVGGLVGGNTGTITNSYSAKAITANAKDAYAGGLVGLLKSGQVKGSYSAGQVNGANGAFAGGFAGYYDNASKNLIDNTYYVKDENKSLNSGLLDFGGGTYYELNLYARLSPILAESLANRTTFPALSGWTFSDTAWRYGSSNAAYQYPELNLSANTGGSSGGSDGGAGGDGGSGNQVNMNINWYTKKPSTLRFTIQTEADLAGLAGIVNGTITGVEPFDFKGREIELAAPIHVQSNQWVPIGYTEQHAFEGTFLGKSQLISGLQVTATPYAGLFGVIGEYATVQDMNVEPVSVQGTQYVGSLAGLNKGSVSGIGVTLAKGAIVANGTFVGGILGRNIGSLDHVTLSLQDGSKVTSAADHAILGGLVGDNVSDISNGVVTLTAGSIEASGENAIVGGAIGRQAGNTKALSISIPATAVVQTSGAGSITGGLIGSYLSGTGDGLAVSLTDGAIKGLGANAILGGAIGLSGNSQVIKNASVHAVNTTAVVNIQGNGLVGGLVGDKTGKGNNTWDVDVASVRNVRLSIGDGGTLGGMVGKLTNAAVKGLAFEGAITASGKDLVVGGIAGHSYDSILYKPEVSPTIQVAVTSGDHSVGGVAGIMEASRPDAALDFGYFIPLYAGIYEANIPAKVIEVTGVDHTANAILGAITGQLHKASIYNSTSAAVLRVTGMKTATLGGIAGLSSGTIVNTSVTSGIEVTSSGDYNIGGIVGQATGGKIAYVRAESPHQEQITIGDSFTVDRAPTATHVGGIVGMADATDMQNVSAHLPIQVSSTNPYNTVYAGGFAGLLGDSTTGLIKRAFAEGTVNVKGKAGVFTGGFAGTINRYQIQEAYASGNVTNTSFDARGGGFAGVINNGGMIADAYASQDAVTVLGSDGATRSYAGGFAGYNDGSLTRVYENVLQISAQAGGANSYMGALIGYNFRDGLVANAYFTGTLTPIKYDTSSGQAGNVKLADFTNHNKLPNWNFGANAATWSYMDGFNHSAPVLVNVTNWSFAPDVSFLQTQVKGDPAFVAASAAQLAGIADVNNDLAFYQWFDRGATQLPVIQKVTLTSDLDLKARLWTPFVSFQGEFDGANHILSGLTYWADQYNHYGFISNNQGTLANVTFDHALITGGTQTGVAVGMNAAGAIVSNVAVTNSKLQGVGAQTGGIAGVNNGTMTQVRVADIELTGTNEVGGVVGTNASAITGAAVHGSLTANGSAIGGIVGMNLPAASITQSFSYADVTANADSPSAGGIAGENDGIIADSYNAGAVTANGVTIARAGGIAGWASAGSIATSVNSGQISANSNGFLVKGKSFFGGIAGQLGQRATLQNNYFDEQMLQMKIAYYNEAGNRVSTDANNAAALKTADLIKGNVPAGLDRTVWTAKMGYYPQLAVANGKTESDLSTVAVILKFEDTAYHVTGSFEQTKDSSIHWSIGKEGAQTVLTASKNGESRSIKINKDPIMYAETAVKPTGTDAAEFKEKIEVTLATTEPSGTIYYTIDGRDPSENSLVYSQAITLNETTTIKAITVIEGSNNSGIFSATYKKMVPPVIGGGSGLGGFTPPPVGSTVDVLVNGKAETAGLETASTNGAVVTSTISVNEEVMGKLLDQQGQQAAITIQFKNRSDIAIGELSAELLQKMANKNADLIVDNGTTRYRIPAQQLALKAISAKLGANVAFKDISVHIEMRASWPEQAKKLANAATAGGFGIMAPPVSFKVTYIYGEKIYELADFSSYVERSVRLASEAEASKVTTGVVMDDDGSIHHVPTQIRRVDGQIYAIIRTVSSSGVFALIANPVSFTDVTSHWAQNVINEMGSRMIVGGVGNQQFQPNRDITRAEFTAIVVKALGIKANAGSSAFHDVQASDWYAPYLQAATQYGIISGYANGDFGGSDAISREQAMTIIARAMQLTGLETQLAAGEADQLLAGFTDASQASDYAKAGIAASLKLGLVSGRTDALMAPGDNMTRAEVAAIIQKLLQKSGLI
ncbi:hypothetical protein A8709_05685 [Paenibacillus pectinilyticus]|uniref:SLH domain-containing protein n=2 Tax=Paenibacillus pectinilyticus TaxID=512399 RepID=A0A1C0ZT20_9BACL|nr:hypothetical protein A8709_05685 [Paenibacillus pectinilyticus]